MTLTLLAAAAEAGHHETGPAPFIAGAIAAAVFLVSAIVLRAYRDVSNRSVGGQTGSTDHV
ncbi:hypothetical protein [Agrococcus terreus]|uniref:4-hydroxybenzoate polyprenyltransferase n=1 Tax=Agrococcus terreus TaxID=574649 RepID=A0ABQ2KJN2_9MICO|nr:hypothetical protein [Agrococcus terreus]GGN85179.1 hypothetical protein GCM10010968_17610 [Agrococcus terreus]